MYLFKHYDLAEGIVETFWVVQEPWGAPFLSCHWNMHLLLLCCCCCRPKVSIITHSIPEVCELPEVLPIRPPCALWCCCSVAWLNWDLDGGTWVSVSRRARAAMLPALMIVSFKPLFDVQAGICCSCKVRSSQRCLHDNVRG